MFGLIKKRLLPGVVAVGVRTNGVAAVRVERSAGQAPRIVARDFRPFGRGQGLRDLLPALAQDMALDRSRCVTVIDNDQYKLLLTETPDVAADEVKDAVRWRIKDLIDFHINDATLELFNVPSESDAPAREIYVVAARNQALLDRTRLLEAAKVHLEVIDIPEFAQRNIAALLPDDASGVALLTFSAAGGLLTITRNSELYLSRLMNIGTDTLLRAYDATNFLDQIVLDVQRSLDFYESHFRQVPVQHLVIAPHSPQIPRLQEHLAANLNVKVRPLDLNEVLAADDAPPVEWQAEHLHTIGAALRT